MTKTKYEPHFYGPVQGVVIGDNNEVTITYVSGHQQTAPFLAPPKPPHKLVGRDTFLKKIKQRLFMGNALALSALNGLPGVGKTAIAVALAHDKQVMAHFTDGVLWAGLGHNADPFRHLGDWMAALNIHETEIKNARTFEERIKKIKIAIHSRRMLLVIDDAWNTEDALWFKIGGPNCAHLLTTRQVHIAFDFAGKEGKTIVHELSLEDGLKLLQQLAQPVVEEESEDAKELVKAVGSLPLALILMGKYLQKEIDSCQTSRIQRALKRLMQVQERLHLEQPSVSVEQHPSLNGISISLQSIIAMTDEVLDEDSRFALRALSVFPPKPNTFSENAATFVTMRSSTTLDTLFDYGILESGGKNRYMIHQTIADYAELQRNDKGAYKLMVEYFVSFVEKHHDDFKMLEIESDNILAALQIAFEQKILSNFILGINAYSNFLHTRGLYKLAETHLNRSLEAAHTLDDNASRTKVLRNLGRISISRGNNTKAQHYFSESVTIAREIEDKEMLSGLLANLGTTALNLGEFKKAADFYQEGLEVAVEIHDNQKVSALFQGLGAVAASQGNYPKAKDHYMKGLSIARDASDLERMSVILSNLGELATIRSNHSEAESYALEGLEIAQKIGHREHISLLFHTLGMIADNQCHALKAKDYYLKGLSIAREIGNRKRISVLLASLSKLFVQQNEFDQAEQFYNDALSLAYEMKNQWLISDIQNKGGIIFIKQQKADLALKAFSEALEIAQKIGAQEYEAEAFYGLAQIVVISGEITTALQHGYKSLNIFKTIGHGKVSEVQEWLNRLSKEN